MTPYRGRSWSARTQIRGGVRDRFVEVWVFGRFVGLCW